MFLYITNSLFDPLCSFPGTNVTKNAFNKLPLIVVSVKENSVVPLTILIFKMLSVFKE